MPSKDKAAFKLKKPEDYTHWKFLLEAHWQVDDKKNSILLGEVLMETIQESGRSGRTIQAFQRADKQMIVDMVRNLSSTYARLVMSKTHFIDMWQALDTHLRGEKKVRLYNLTTKLRTLQWRGNLKQLLLHFTQVTDEYLNLGGSYTEGDMCEELLRALPPKFDDFVVQMRRDLKKDGRDQFTIKELTEDLELADAQFKTYSRATRDTKPRRHQPRFVNQRNNPRFERGNQRAMTGDHERKRFNGRPRAQHQNDQENRHQQPWRPRRPWNSNYNNNRNYDQNWNRNRYRNNNSNWRGRRPNNRNHSTRQMRNPQEDVNIGKSDSDSSSSDSEEQANHATHVNKTRTNDFIIDSGATLHTTTNIALLTNSIEVKIPIMTAAQGQTITATHRGTLIGKLRNGKRISIKDVHYVPGGTNLLSVKQLLKQGKIVNFTKDSAEIYSKKGKLEVQAKAHDRLWTLSIHSKSPTATSKAIMWHHRLGHLNPKYMRELIQNNKSIGNIPDLDQYCIGCMKGKLTKKPILKLSSNPLPDPQHPLECLHLDSVGPFATRGLGCQSKGFVLITDKYARYRWIVLYNKKKEIPEKLTELFARLQRFHHPRIRRLHSDNGTEFDNTIMKDYCRKEGITQTFSAPGVPQQNGLAERSNKTIIEGARSLLFAAELSRGYWPYAMKTKVYVMNRSPARSNKHYLSPYQKMFGKSPDLRHLRIFGCPGFAVKDTTRKTKLDSRAQPCIFLGYTSYGSNYVVLFTKTRVISTVRTINLDESGFLKLAVNRLNELHFGRFDPLNDQKHQDKLSKDGLFMQKEEITYVSLSLAPFVATLMKEDDENVTCPRNYYEMKGARDAKEWLKAYESELQSLETVGQLRVTERPSSSSVQVLPVLELLSVKYDTVQKLTKRKVRIVVQGNREKSLDDTSTLYSPVASYDVIKLIIALSGMHGLYMRQLDIKTAYLYGRRKKDLYIELPRGHPQKQGTKYV